jgi:hypothetical protein
MAGIRYSPKRQRSHNQFARIVFWLGFGLINALLIWIVVMVVLQAIHGWKR